MVKKKFEFDFALSFAGAQRNLARKLFNVLDKKGFNVFYDEKYAYDMLGENGVDYLREVYSERSRYCIVVISKEYDKGVWPKIEREIIVARQAMLGHGILLPVLTDDHMPKWLLPTRIHFDLRSRPFDELIKILVKKAWPPLESLETDEKKPVNCDDYNWDKLLGLIKSKSVIPVISQGLYSIVTKEKEELFLYDFLARQVAQKIGMPLSHTFTSVCAEYLKKNKCGQLKKVLNKSLEGVQLTKDNSLLKLARIRYFDIFLTTAYDNLLGYTIKETRDLRLEVRSYAKNEKKFDLLEKELFDNIRDSQCLLVYHMLGNLKRNFAPAYTLGGIRDTLLKFLDDMNKDFQNRNNLFRELKNRCFLFLGFKPEDQVLQLFIPGFVNWLSGTKRDSSTRLFIGGIRGFNENKPIDKLLEHLRTDEIEVIDFMESEDFVDCLCQKLEQTPGPKIDETGALTV
jgi:hypothetical protein